MGELLVFLLVAYGASNIMVYSTIFAGFRRRIGAEKDEPTSFFGKLFSCMMCLPFWWGVLLSVFMYSPTNMFATFSSESLISDMWIGNYNPMMMFLDGCLASGGVWLLHTIQERLES